MVMVVQYYRKRDCIILQTICLNSPYGEKKAICSSMRKDLYRGAEIIMVNICIPRIAIQIMATIS